MVTNIEALQYIEALELPKFKASLDRLLNKKAYDLVLSTYSVTAEELPQFTDKAIGEGNAVLIQREWFGYMVVCWKD